MSRRFIIDTDTASDDAVALLMALSWPDVQVEAITIVAGNVPLAQASINARYTVELSGQRVPVYEGASHPLLRPPEHAEWFHGPDGMGGRFYPAPHHTAAGQDAIQQLIERFRAAPGQISLVTLGPLTNIALALRIEPRLAGWVKEAFVMGGAACCVGNVTPAAEYNIWFDPEAARIVFESGMKILMIGWEHSRGAAALTDEERQQIEQSGSERAHFAMECNEHALIASREIQHAPGLMLADPVAMAVALDPQVCTQRSAHFVEIECQSALTRGMTVVDQLGVKQQPANVDVCWAIDPAHWKATLRRALGAA